VILSACDTAAGENPKAEALSGLTSAFLFAGARGVIVSHWRVVAGAGTRLMPNTLVIRDDEKRSVGDVRKRTSHAAGLRRAMLQVLDTASSLIESHPSYWAPFVIVTDGGAKN
jgi:CHAT domain-containing protein